MSNDFTKVYQFLSSYNQNGKTWVDTADKNEDGIIIKAEFTEFVNENYKNWSGNESGETLSADIINNFWKKIDTTVSGKVAGSSKSNRNALDKNEQANLDKKLEAYVALNDFIKENVNIPSVLTTTGAQWKAAVSDELSAILEKNASKGADALVEIWTEKLPEIENKQTALFCATEYQNTLVNGLLKDYPDYKVADDSTLNKLIDAYLKTINGDSDPSTIKSDIQEIMKTYLATAGLGEGGSYDLSALGYEMKDGDKLNGIQEAVVKASIKKNLEGIKTDANYEKYKEYYDKAIEEFINAEVGKATVGTFDAVKGTGLEAFKESKAYKNIQNRVTFDTLFNNSEVADTNKLYKALETEFGKIIAERIVKNSRYMDTYTSITTAALEKVNAGEFLKEDGSFDTDAVLKYVVDEIGKNLVAFTDGLSGDMSLEGLQEIYNKRTESAKKMESTEDSLTAIHNAAIDYCKSVAAKSTALENAVIEAFFPNDCTKTIADVTALINKMYPADIDETMAKLIIEVNKIGDSSKWGLKTITGAPAEGTSIIIGTSATYQLTPTLKDDKGTDVTHDATKIKYNVASVSGGEVSIDDLGQMTIKAGSARGFVKATIEVMYDGKVIDKQEISVKVSDYKDLVNDIGNDKWGGSSEHLEVFGCSGYTDGATQVTGCSFKDLYNNNAVIMLHQGKGNGDHKGTVKERLTALCGFITNALAGKGLDAAKLQTAKNTVIENLMAGFGRKGKSRDNTERDALGTRVSNKIKANEFGGVVKFTDFKRKDYQVNMVSFKEVVDMILAEYQKL